MFSAAEISTDIEYGPPRDGIPLLRKVTVREGEDRATVCEIGGWSFVPTPISEFQMPYYEIPDLTAKPTNAWRYMTYAIAASGLAALAGAILLRHLGNPTSRRRTGS